MQALLIINKGFLLVSKGYGVGAALFNVNRGIIYRLFFIDFIYQSLLYLVCSLVLINIGIVGSAFFIKLFKIFYCFLVLRSPKLVVYVICDCLLSPSVSSVQTEQAASAPWTLWTLPVTRMTVTESQTRG